MIQAKCFVFVAVLTLFVLFDAQSDDGRDVQERDAALNRVILNHNADSAVPYYMDDFLLITSSGTFKTKEAILKDIQNPDLKWEINETTEVLVRVHGDAAVLTGVLHQKGTFSGKSFDVKLFVTDTWIRSGNSWKILSGHASKVPEKQ